MITSMVRPILNIGFQQKSPCSTPPDDISVIRADGNVIIKQADTEIYIPFEELENVFDSIKLFVEKHKNKKL